MIDNKLSKWIPREFEGNGIIDWSVNPIVIREKDTRIKKIPKKYLKSARYIIFNWLLGKDWERSEQDNLLHWKHDGTPLDWGGFRHAFPGNKGLGDKEITDLLDIQRASPFEVKPEGSNSKYRAIGYFEKMILFYWRKNDINGMKTTYIINTDGEYETIYEWATRIGLFDYKENQNRK